MFNEKNVMFFKFLNNQFKYSIMGDIIVMIYFYINLDLGCIFFKQFIKGIGVN